MSKDFENHMNKRIKEMSERLHNYRTKKKEKIIIFSQREKKRCKNIN